MTFYRDARRRVSSIVARGHAEAGSHGSDVVCAAVSAILQAARLGLEEHAKVRLDAAMEPGAMHLRWPPAESADPAVKAIVATTELSIAAIAREHPKHVRIRRRSGNTG